MLSSRGGVKWEKTFRGLLGNGALAVWCDTDPRNEAEFNNWYTQQHLPERVGIPGFLRGRRYMLLDNVPPQTGATYFALYETESLETLASAAYLKRLENPTEWTRRVGPMFRNVNRTAYRVTASLGQGIGGTAATIEFRPLEANSNTLRSWLRADAMPRALERDAGLVGIHLCEADRATTKAKDITEEGKSPGGRDPLARWFLMIEASDHRALEGVCSELSGGSGLAQHGAAADINVNRYRLLVSLSE